MTEQRPVGLRILLDFVECQFHGHTNLETAGLPSLEQGVEPDTLGKGDVPARIRRLEPFLAGTDDRARPQLTLSRQVDFGDVFREATLTELERERTRIADLEAEAVEQFTDHMDDILDVLDFENLARVWIERTADDSVRGPPEPVFDLNVVREGETGTVYEDVVAHLSESEREVVGLVVALAGYLAHEASEVVPFMLLDSLEAIDSNRIAALVDYFADYVPHLVVALLPEDAEGLSADYERLTADALTASPRRGGSFTSRNTI